MWVQDEAAAPELVGRRVVLAVLPAELSQRQDREHNPHGEHAHDVWVIASPPPGVWRGGGGK